MKTEFKKYLFGKLKREAKKLGVKFDEKFIANITKEQKIEWANEIISYSELSRKVAA